MNAPKDPILFLTVFVAACLLVILVTWFLMPVYHHGEYYEGEEVEAESKVGLNLVLSPDKLLKKVNASIQQGEAALIQLEAEEKEREETEASEEKKPEEK